MFEFMFSLLRKGVSELIYGKTVHKGLDILSKFRDLVE